MKKLIFAACLAASFATIADAQEKTCSDGSCQNSAPLAVGLLPCLEAPAECWNVTGVRLDLFAGRHQNVLFLSVGGLADLVTKEAEGVEIAGLYNRIGKSAGIFQLAGLVNRCDGDLDGAQIGGIYNDVGGRSVGLSVSALTKANTLEGLQVGLVNRARQLTGVQIGAVNFADESEGIQIGIVNVMKDGKYPVMPIANLGF